MDKYLSARQTLKVMERGLRALERGRTFDIRRALDNQHLVKDGFIHHHMMWMHAHGAFLFQRTIHRLYALRDRMTVADRHWITLQRSLCIVAHSEFRREHNDIVMLAYQTLLGRGRGTLRQMELVAEMVQSPYWLGYVMLRDISPIRLPLAGPRVLQVVKSKIVGDRHKLHYLLQRIDQIINV